MVIEIITSYIDFHVIESLRELRVKSTPYVDQMELAQRIGVSEGYIGQIENPRYKAKYNMRMMSRAARALHLKSYNDIFPKEVLIDDLVRIRLKLLKSKTKRHEIDVDGNVIKRFEILSIIPLNNEDVRKWDKRELQYLTIIEK